MTVQIRRSTTPGNAPSSLLVGELAINEADQRLYHRNAAGAVTYSDLGRNQLSASEHSPSTEGQTVFSVGNYTVGSVSIYVNGVLIASTDYTATNGTTITLGSGLEMGDILTVVRIGRAAVSGGFTAQETTAGAAQTTFTVSGGYTVGQIVVYLNGVLLPSSEFTATNGTSIILATASVAGDILTTYKMD